MAENVDALAADIRRVDGDHSLGAGELAEALSALGWEQFPPVYLDPATGKLTFTIQDMDPVASETMIEIAFRLQQDLASVRALNTTPAPTGEVTLKTFKPADTVEVMKDGSWIAGRVYENREHGVSVETESGPITIGSLHRIRYA